MIRALVAASLVLAACGSTPPPPAETPDTTPPPADTGVKTDDPPKTDDVKPDKPAAKPAGVDVPEDYALTNLDCDELGKQYGQIATDDKMAELSPKLTEKQRDTARANIDKVIGPMSDRWIAGCQKSLVGQVVERSSLKCAMAAKTVKAFDVCINGEAASKPGKK